MFLEENISGGQVTVDNLILLQKLHPSANLRRNNENVSIAPSRHHLVAVLQESLTGISSHQVQFSAEVIILILESITVLMQKTLQISL